MKTLKRFIGIALLAVAPLFAGTSTASAAERVITTSQLPAKAQTTLSNHFSNEKITRVFKDVNSRGVAEYEVDFTAGRDIEFDSTGNWTSIDCKGTAVPDALVPQAIRNYVARNVKSGRIISIDKERKGYNVKLTNGYDYHFDVNGKFRFAEPD